MKVLAVGPHPDDVEIGMGGTVLALRAAGHEVVVCDLTNGEPTPIGTPERRAREAAAAAQMLGVRRVTLEMPNRYLADTVDARNRVAEVIREVRPEMLFIPYWADAHPDHVSAASLCEAARFYAKLTRTTIRGEPVYPRRVVHYICTHYNLHIQPSFIMDVTPHIDVKLRAVAAYGSQFGPERGNEGFFEDLRAWNRYFGALIRTGYGEPFVLREEVGLRGLDQFI